MNWRDKVIKALVCITGVILHGVVWAASQTLTPSTCTNVTGVGTQAWSTPGNAGALDSTYATSQVTNLAGSSTSNYLQCTGYGFSVPATATINGVVVTVARATSSVGSGGLGTQDNAMRLVKAGAIGTTDRSTTTLYTTSIVSEAHGTATDLWGTTLTPTDVNASNFGAAFSTIQTYGSLTRTVSVDVIQITVYYTVPFSCSPPSNIPSGVSVSCVCDTFARASLNPSTIYGSNWIVSTSDSTGILPSIVNSGYLRLTNNTGNNAKAATVPGIFPAAGNYISVEFQHFAYNGSGADGIAVTLSDYSVPAVPGAYGGSLGYAQKTGINGFAGGWVGIALDEYGNYQNATEGRIGGPGFVSESVGVRGSGSGTNGYQWLAGTSTLSPQIDNPSATSPSPGYYYQVIVDARNDPTSTSVIVNRDTGSGYANLINIPNVYTAATAQGFTQSTVPANWQISFTGSTGGSTNIHELSGVRICAQSVAPPSGGTASGFNAIDEAYGTPPSVAVQNYLTGHIYMKLTGVPFKLNVAALNNNQIQTAYVGSGTKNVTLKLVDNSDNACVLDSTQPNYCNATCQAKTAIASQVLSYSATDKGQKQSASFTINSAYQNLVAIINDSSTTACSTDSFSVRPTAVTAFTSSALTSNAASKPKAGSTAVTFTATTTAVNGTASNYNGTLKLNNAALSNNGNGFVAYGSFSPTSFPAAVPSGTTGTSISTGTFTYSEVGGIQFNGYDPTVDANTPRGIYDDSWSTIDSASSKGDCNVGSYSNVKDANGKYGCNFGLNATLPSGAYVGRFIPDHFAISGGTITNRSDIAACNAVPASNLFTYFGEQMTGSFTLTAQAGGNTTTKNYNGAAVSLDPSQFANLNIGVADRTSYPGTPGYWSNTAGTVTAGSTAVSCSTSPCFISGVASVTAPFVVTRAASPTLAQAGPFTGASFGVKVQDGDGVVISPLNMDATTAAGTTLDRGTVASIPNLKYGRLVIDNAYGSELFTLPVNVRAEYWNNGAWVTNVSGGNGSDSCSPINNTTLTTSQAGGATVTTSFGGITLNNGTGTLVLSKPNPALSSKGSIKLTAGGQIANYLPGSAIETFGVYKAGPMIYIRELY